MDTQMDWHVRFGADFDSDDERGRPGKEMPLGRSFLWNGVSWRIPSLYFCDEGLVIDFLMQVPDDALRAWIDRWGLTPESEEEDYTPEQSAQIMFENPAVLFTPSVRLNGRKLLMECGHSLSWLSLFPDRSDRDWPLVRPYFLFSRARPYFPSPKRGWPAAANWARIWWVRPVSSLHSTRDSPRPTFRV